MSTNLYSKTQIKQAKDGLKEWKKDLASIRKIMVKDEKILNYIKRRNKAMTKLYFTLEKDLTYFKGYNFNISGNVVTFNFTDGVDKEVVSTESICNEEDYFDELIGKYIAVKKALGEKFNKAIYLIEQKPKLESFMNTLSSLKDFKCV